MGKSGRRLERKNTKKATVKQIMDESVKAGVIEAAAIACEVIYNNYGKLRNKEQHLKELIKPSEGKVYAEHNEAYLQECIDNLRAKGIELAA